MEGAQRNASTFQGEGKIVLAIARGRDAPLTLGGVRSRPNVGACPRRPGTGLHFLSDRGSRNGDPVDRAAQ